MGLFDKQTLKAKVVNKYGTFAKAESLNQLTRSSQQFSASKTYDIFLSHSFLDAELIEALKEEFEGLGLKVYVDWIEDRQLDRSAVTSETAKTIKERMKCCKSLIYAFSDNSSKSKWMPWELGFFDGYKGIVAVLPVVETPTSSEAFVGTEFLGIYPYIVNTSGTLFAHRSLTSYVGFKDWLNGAVKI